MKIFEITIFGISIAPSYYGLAYGISFLLGYLLFKKRGILSEKETDSLLIYIFVGVIFGGRIGYVIFYNFDYYTKNILEIVKMWKGGMSFHGGLLGVIIGTLVFVKLNKYDNIKEEFFKITDNLATVFPIGLFLGRIGNYINKELLGMEYNGFLAVQKNGISYFPSPLLEAFLEGIILFIITNYFYKKNIRNGFISGLFLVFYSIFRFLVEFIRLPDIQIGYIAYGLTMGQILCIPMLLSGLYLSYAKNNL